MLSLADWVEASALAEALRGSGTSYMLLNAAHILGLGLLVGAIVPLDLRLIGIVRGPDVRLIGPFLSRTAGAGLAIALLTGPALWSVRAVDYLGNAAFLWKIGLVALGMAIVVLQHAGGGWRRAMASGEASLATKLLAALSLTIWIAALLAGRWIGFL